MKMGVSTFVLGLVILLIAIFVVVGVYTKTLNLEMFQFLNFIVQFRGF